MKYCLHQWHFRGAFSSYENVFIFFFIVFSCSYFVLPSTCISPNLIMNSCLFLSSLFPIVLGNRKHVYLLYLFFVISLFITRVEICSSEDKKKENGIKHIAGMTSKRDEVGVRSENFERHLNLLHAVRTQMQARHRFIL